MMEATAHIAEATVMIVEVIAMIVEAIALIAAVLIAEEINHIMVITAEVEVDILMGVMEAMTVVGAKGMEVVGPVEVGGIMEDQVETAAGLF